MTRWAQEGVPWAGLFGGPAAWGVSTQAGYALVPMICNRDLGRAPVAALTVLLVAIALAAAFLSWRAWWRVDPSTGGTDRAPRQLVAGIGALLGLLFGLVIATQGGAALFLQGCER